MDANSASPATMRAAVVSSPGVVRLATIERPTPGPGQVRVKLEGCGVCASNLTPWAGPEWQSFPLEPGALGHEGWGVIDALGPDVAGLSRGARVASLADRSCAEDDLAVSEAVLILPHGLAGQPFPG